MPAYTPGNFSSTFSAIRSHFPASQYAFRAALFNVGYAVWKPFLEVTPEEVQECPSPKIILGNICVIHEL